jgi:hypothetical protein
LCDVKDSCAARDLWEYIYNYNGDKLMVIYGCNMGIPQIIMVIYDYMIIIVCVEINSWEMLSTHPEAKA